VSLVREDVYVALANLVFTDARVISMFVTTGRYLPTIFAGIEANQCPALFMFQHPEMRVNQGKGIPPKRTLTCAFVAYFASETPQVALPATAIDNIVSEPGNPGNVQTLGGLVEHVYIEPAIEPFEGLLQEKSALVAVVRMLVP
jgi:hypothetical protein